MIEVVTASQFQVFAYLNGLNDLKSLTVVEHDLIGITAQNTLGH